MRDFFRKPGATCLSVPKQAGLIADSQMRGHSNLLVAILLLTIFVWAAAQAAPSFLSSGLLPHLGRVSFSVYILHGVVLGALYHGWRLLPLHALPTLSFVLFYAAGVALTTAAATLTFRYIEQPFVRMGRKVGMVPQLAAG